ncbi:MAG: hypothetical protein ACXIU8_04870 [Alkalilacustris sp.]
MDFALSVGLVAGLILAGLLVWPRLTLAGLLVVGASVLAFDVWRVGPPGVGAERFLASSSLKALPDSPASAVRFDFEIPDDVRARLLERAEERAALEAALARRLDGQARASTTMNNISTMVQRLQTPPPGVVHRNPPDRTREIERLLRERNRASAAAEREAMQVRLISARLTELPPALDPAFLGRASVAFVVPPEMTYRQAASVRLFLAPGLDREQLRVRVAPSPNATVEIDEDVEYAEHMRATLSGGEAFVISPDAPQPRRIRGARLQTWTWQVTPIRFGQNLPLDVSLEAVLRVDGSDDIIAQETYHATITVHVGMWELLVHRSRELEPVQAMVTGLVATLIAALTFGFTHLRRRPAAPPAPPTGATPPARPRAEDDETPQR